MTDILQTDVSPSDVRAKLEEMVMKDLLGPAGSETEFITERNVHGRYLVGMLAPRGSRAQPEELDDLSLGGNDTEDGTADSAMPATATMMPSAIGLTFSVDGSITELNVHVHWGCYKREDHRERTTKSGAPLRGWQRVPMGGELLPISLQVGPMKKIVIDEEYPDVFVQGIIRRHESNNPTESTWTVTLFLVNDQPEPKQLKDEAWLFQPEIIVEAPEKAVAFRRRPYFLTEPTTGLPEDLALDMAYRHHIEFAVGHGVGVHAETPPQATDRAIRLTTRFVPACEVPKVTPPTPEDIPALANLVIDMKILAETSDADFAHCLSPLVDAYADWIEDQAQKLASGVDGLTLYKTTGQTVLENCRQTTARIQAGLDFLATNPQAAEAFRFANRAMWQQRIRTQYSERVRRGEKPDLEQEIDKSEHRSWYPFQLAFVLLNLPALTQLHHKERSHPTSAIADLLWFPTGGGKTEAYLGVAAYTMGLRRLQGEVAGRSGMAGVAVLMRYTLRLLTLQQFQRATTLICACERIRQEAVAQGDLRWGEEPFRIGLWVGQRTTPNWTQDSNEAVKRDHGQFSKSTAAAGLGSPVQLTNCPWCGSPINAGKNIRVETYKEGRGRTFIYCGDPLGRCPFTQKRSPNEGIPALVVDEEIYRRLPTLLIATVDKFAQMPWKGAVQMLFGQVNGYCSRHGFCSPDLDSAGHASHPRKGKHPPTQLKMHSPLRPPDLIIQDELHLISGPLGTMMGLYETAVDHLTSWQVDGETIRPKVIASTATIRRAQDQVHALFLRQVNIFPPQGLDVQDNFFARQRPPSDHYPGRRYVGICAPGTRLKATMIRVYVAVMAAAQTLYKDPRYGHVADPWMTLVGYFNAMRELGGMRRVIDDAVRTRLLRMSERQLANRSIDPWGIEELTSRKGATDIPKILDRLEAPFDPAAEVKRKQQLKAGTKGDFSKVPLDVLLATNMISVGVDVKRLGLMVVASQPKTTAEYIQATSRVGRTFPGLVFTVFNWARPRDLSHYERFEHYHATFYQHVEALSVTPFSPRALDRGLAALLVSEIRLAGEAFNENSGAGQIDRLHPYVVQALEGISKRAGAAMADVQITHDVRQYLEKRLDEWLNDASQKAKHGAKLGYRQKQDGVTLPLLEMPGLGKWENFTCPNSMRNVEPTVNLIFNDYGMDREPDPQPNTVQTMPEEEAGEQ